MHYNEVTVISDGLEARIGSITANQEWFKVWRTIEGEFDAPATALGTRDGWSAVSSRSAVFSV